MYKVLPLFKSHYSIGKSVLTLDKPEEHQNNGPDSIIRLCKEAKINTYYLVEDSISGFLQAHINSKANKLKMIYGLRLTVCDNVSEKNEESLSSNNKVIVFCKNEEGYKRLIKIYSFAARDGFYYKPRIDYENLKRLWVDEDLKLCIPFYDSYIFNNMFLSAKCMPNFSFTTPEFFVEDNDLPFDDYLKLKLEKILNGCCPIHRVKSIFYNKKEDFINYLTFRCINKRTTLDKPQFEHMTSNEFCFESWQEEEGKS